MTGAVRSVRADARFCLATCWRTHRTLTLAIVALPLAQGLVPAALALTLRGLINEIGAARAGNGGGWGIGAWVIAGAAIAFANAALGALNAYAQTTMGERLDERISVDLAGHASRLDFAVFEDLAFQDTLSHITEGPAGHVQEFVRGLVNVASGIVRVVSLLAVLYVIQPLLLVLLAPLAVPYLLWQLRISRRRYDEIRAQRTKRRWSQYYLGQLTSAGSLPEIRILDLGPLFVARTQALLTEFRRRNHRHYVVALVGSLAFALVSIAIVYWCLYDISRDVVDGRLQIGDVAVFGAAALGLRGALDTLIGAVGGIRWHTLWVTEVRTFLALPPPVPAAPVSLAPGGPGHLVLDGVTFAYPGTDHDVLHDLRLDVAPGEVVAIVGENGSGKSTLVKVIAGLYAPDRGRILLDDVDLAHVDPHDRAREITFVFQGIGRYEATAGENVAFGDWPTLLDDPDATRAVIDRVGLGPLVDRMPDGQHTLLGRRFGTYEASGGQWQQLAIARANARPGALQILDEPTSNLDVETEYRIFSRFRDLARGRTTLLISHRFSTVALADRIVVMEAGHIVESGTHDELMARNGTYARMYRLHRRDVVDPDELTDETDATDDTGAPADRDR